MSTGCRRVGQVVTQMRAWTSLITKRPQWVIGSTTLAIFGLAVVGMIAPSGAWVAGVRTKPPQEVLPKREDGNYVTSNTCRACHPGHYASWHDTFHRTMTQVASPETVVAPFEGVSLEVDGQTARLERRGDEFWVEMTDPAWEQTLFSQWAAARGTGAPDPFETFDGSPPRIEAQVVMTTGSHHFQAFWIGGPKGRELWQFPWRYHLAEQRWVHRKDVFLAPPEWRPGMWFRVWNHQCSVCHSVGPKPGLNRGTQVMEHTQVAELGIACEACHGPAEAHVRVNRNPLRRYAQYKSSEPDPTIINPARLSHERSSEICGACHSHFAHDDPKLYVDGPRFRPGDRLSDYGTLRDLSGDGEVMSRFWADGANRSGGREFSGMVQSACYQMGTLSCLSCHSMHASDPKDQLARGMEGNQACYQCHSEYRDRLTEHTHHPADSSGSQCYNCHMPHTNYALFKAIRSHRIDIPRVTSVSPNARPNACNLCHLDKPLSWTAEHLAQWYGTPPASLLEDERQTGAGLVWALRGDAGQRVIAAWHLGWQPAREASGTYWMLPVLSQLLKDPYAAVRWVAYDALRVDSYFSSLRYDFDGPLASREAVAQQVMAHWRERDGSSALPANGSPHVLLDQQGWLRQSDFDWLLLNRDDRPVAGVE